MASESLELETLTHLGLTWVQARVYLALTKHGRLKISAISELSKVARPDVYRVLKTLDQLGLVESYVGTPAEFKAIPPENALKLLLSKKTSEHDDLKKETELLITSLRAREAPEETKTPAGGFALVPQKAMVVKIQNEAIEGAQCCIQIILTWSRFRHGVYDLFSKSMKVALKRKVRFKFLIEKPPSEELVEKAIEICKMGEGVEVRFLDGKPETIVAVYDYKKMMILVDPFLDYPGSSPALWTENKSFVSLAREYFDMKWAAAKCP